MRFADEHLDKSFERIRASDAPIWEHQAHVGRTIITLASSGIVLSVSVVQLFHSEVILHWAWLLPTSWILWTGSILSALTREAWLSTARALPAYFERQRGIIRASIRALPPGSTAAEFDRVLTDAYAEADKAPAKARLICNRLSIAMYFGFALGMIAVVAFAIRNLPT